MDLSGQKMMHMPSIFSIYQSKLCPIVSQFLFTISFFSVDFLLIYRHVSSWTSSWIKFVCHSRAIDTVYFIPRHLSSCPPAGTRWNIVSVWDWGSDVVIETTTVIKLSKGLLKRMHLRKYLRVPSPCAVAPLPHSQSALPYCVLVAFVKFMYLV